MDSPALNSETLGRAARGAADAIARLIFEELEFADPSDPREWHELPDLEKEVFRSVVNGLLSNWPLLQQAHAS